MESISKEQVFNALKSSLIGNSQLLKEVTAFLEAAQQRPGYTMTLMELIDDSNCPLEVRQAALIQLKNTVKSLWKEENGITPEQKNNIKGALVKAVIRCGSWYTLLKLYRQIFGLLMTYQYESWVPLNQLLQYLRLQQQSVPAMHCIYSISKAFQFNIADKEKKFAFNYHKAVLPDLLLLKDKSNTQAIYLSFKYLWRVVHYETNRQVLRMIIEFMPTLVNVVGLAKEQFHTGNLEHQTRGSDNFFYFHSKKWIYRIFNRLLMKHFNPKQSSNNQDKEISVQWFEAYGKPYVVHLINHLNLNYPKKVRNLQLKNICTLINQHPDIMQAYANHLQYNKLLPYMRLGRQDQILAEEDVVEYMSKQEEYGANFNNLKKAASDCWVAYADLGFQFARKTSPYVEGKFFRENIMFLKNKLESSDLLEKELAMFLFCQLRISIKRNAEIKQNMPFLVQNFVLPEFQSQVMFLRARAADILYDFGDFPLSDHAISTAVQALLKCLSGDHPLVKIKAALAFVQILKHDKAKTLVAPHLSEVLKIYITLLNQYDLQKLVNGLQSIIQQFSEHIGPFALEMGQYLSTLFIRLYEKDISENQNNKNYEGEAELAASGCLKAFSQIIAAPITQQTIKAMQPQVQNLLEFVFQCDSTDYVGDILQLLSVYLEKIEEITPPIWFYYQIVIYNLVGLPEQGREQILALPVKQSHKKIFLNLMQADNPEMIELSMPALKAFIHKAATNTSPNQQMFKANLNHLLFYLIAKIYKNGPTDITGEADMMACTALLCSLVQANQTQLNEKDSKYIWDIIIYNLTKGSSRSFKCITSQLVGLMLWTYPSRLLLFIEKSPPGTIQLIIKELIQGEPVCEEGHQRKRLILGICSYLRQPHKDESLANSYKDLFKVLTKMIRTNIQEKTKKQKDQNELEQEWNDQIDNSEYALAYDEDDDHFFEDYYSASQFLKKVNEVQYFYDTMGYLQTNNNNFYTFLCGAVSQDYLLALDDKIKKYLAENK